MALSENRELKLFASQALVDLPVEAGQIIYKGAFIGLDDTTGYAQPLTAGDTFVGVAYAKADNSGGASGAINVRAHQAIDIVHTLTGVTQANVGALVYASADDTLTLTSTSNSRVGRVVAVEGANLARVRIQPTFSI